MGLEGNGVLFAQVFADPWTCESKSGCPATLTGNVAATNAMANNRSLHLALILLRRQPVRSIGTLTDRATVTPIPIWPIMESHCET